MLQGKVIAARNNKSTMFCYDKNYTGDEIEQMLIIADDLKL
jgi:hypothetical protein